MTSIFKLYSYVFIFGCLLCGTQQTRAESLRWDLISVQSMMEPRYGHQAFVVANQTEPARILIYGGKQADGVMLNGILQVQTQTLGIETIATEPSMVLGRAFASGTGIDGIYVTFGGINQSFMAVNEFQVLHSRQFPLQVENENAVITQSTCYHNHQLFDTFPGVPCIQGMASTVDPNTQIVYFLGGQTNIQTQGQLPRYSSCIFGYSTVDKNWFLASPFKNCYAKPPEAPEPRAFATAVEYQGNIYYFGGSVLRLSQSTPSEPTISFFNDLWQFNLQTGLWKRLQLSGALPLARDGHTATLRGSHMYVFGGRTCENTAQSSNCSIDSLQFLNDLWTLDLENCTTSHCSWDKKLVANSSSGAPVPRAFHQAVAWKQGSSAFDWSDLWIIAGVSSAEDGGILGDIWTLRFPPNPNSPAQVSVLSAANSHEEYIYCAFQLHHLLAVNFTTEANIIFESYLGQLLSNAGVLTQEIGLVAIHSSTHASSKETTVIYAAKVDLRQTTTAIDALKNAPWDPLQQLSNVPSIVLLRVASGQLGTFERALETVPSHSNNLSTTIIVIIVVTSVSGFLLIIAIAALIFWKMYSKRATTSPHPTSKDMTTPRLAYSLDGIPPNNNILNNHTNTETDNEIQPASPTTQ